MTELKGLLEKADAQRAWVLPRTVPLRVQTAMPTSVAEIRPAAVEVK